MLKSLTIKNFAIIDSLEIDFDSGLSIITGETGAGKSIFIGALSLVMGNRAELSQIKDKSKKCIIEAIFDIRKHNNKTLFADNDIDYEDSTIVRREILISGKSRAFINDTPVNLNVLKSFGVNLIDIHSQHQSLLIGDNQFQLLVIDDIAKLNKAKFDFKEKFQEFNTEKDNLQKLIDDALKSKKDQDYLDFLFNQLYDAKLSNQNEISELEGELNQLSHSEEIKQALTGVSDQLQNDEISSLNTLNNSLSILSKVKSYFGKGEELYNRINSVEIELKDIVDEIDTLSFEIEYDPGRIEILTERLDLLNSLLQKNKVSDIEQLISMRDSLEKRILDIDSFDDRIYAHRVFVENLEKNLIKSANQISKKRIQVIPDIEKKVNALLHKLGMQSARFNIQITKSEVISETGFDDVSFLFSSSKKGDLQEIGKIASGGELSRLMLCIKSLIARSANLPTIVFDEIDTGVSGEIADKVGNIIKEISEDIQVINITHLPQVAVKGDKHFRIYKIEEDNGANTKIELLDEESRLQEIAKMLSGSDVTKAAIENAKILLEQVN